MRNVLGMRMVLDTSRFVEGAKIANRALASMEYVAGRTSKRMSQFGVELESLGYIAGAGLIGAAGAAFQSRALWEKVIGPAIDGATQFDKRLRQAYYLSGMQAGTSLADGFKAEIEKAALFSSLNPEQLTQGLNELIKTGVDSSDAKKMIQPLIDIVEGSFGEVDPERAGRMMGLLSLKFKRPDTVGVTEWATKLGDMSFALAEMTHLNIGDIESMIGSMSSAVALSPSTKPAEFFALMKMLSDSSMKARRQGQNLDSFANMFLSMFSKLEAGSKKTVKGFEMLFGEANAGNILQSMFVMDPATGQYVQKSMGDTLGLVLDQLPRLINEMGAEGRKTWIQAVDEMFGQDVGTRFALLAEGFTTKDASGNILKGSAAIKEMTKQFDKMSGNAKKAADAYRASWEGIGKAIQGAYETFMSMIGDEMLNILSSLILGLKDATASLVLFTQQRPLLRQVLAVLLMISFATGMIAAGFFSILSVATMFLIFMAPGMGSIISLMKTLKERTSDWKNKFVELSKTSRPALIKMRKDLEKVNDQIDEMLPKLGGIGAHLAKMAKAKNQNALLGINDNLAIFNKLSVVAGILGFIFVTATVAVFTFSVALMAVYRLMSSPLFKGKGGFMEGIINKIKIAKNVFQGLSEVFTKGFLSGETFDKLNKEGGLAILENILKLGYRLYTFFKGIAEGIDWSGFDAALKLLMDTMGGGGPMDTAFKSSGASWNEIGKMVGKIITIYIDFAGIMLILLYGIIKVTKAVKNFVGANASLIETIATIGLILLGLITLVGLAMFVIGGFLLFVGGVFVTISLTVGAVLLLIAAVPLIIAAVIIGIVLLIEYAIYSMYEKILQSVPMIAKGFSKVFHMVEPFFTKIADGINYLEDTFGGFVKKIGIMGAIAGGLMWFPFMAPLVLLLLVIKIIYMKWDALVGFFARNIKILGALLLSMIVGLSIIIMPFMLPIYLLIVGIMLAYMAIKRYWTPAIDELSTRLDPLIQKMQILKDLALGFAQSVIPGVGLYTNWSNMQKTFDNTQNTGPAVPYVDSAVRTENAAVGAYNQTINLTANITVPPETPTDQVSKALADQLGRYLNESKKSSDRGYQLEYD